MLQLPVDAPVMASQDGNSDRRTSSTFRTSATAGAPSSADGQASSDTPPPPPPAGPPPLDPTSGASGKQTNKLVPNWVIFGMFDRKKQ